MYSNKINENRESKGNFITHINKIENYDISLRHTFL